MLQNVCLIHLNVTFGINTNSIKYLLLKNRHKVFFYVGTPIEVHLFDHLIYSICNRLDVFLAEQDL